MRDVLIMLLATLVVLHSVTRLGMMPKLSEAPVRTKVLIVSIIIEFTGAAFAFLDAYLLIFKDVFATHHTSVLFLLGAVCLTPIADPRLGKRSPKFNEAHQ